MDPVLAHLLRTVPPGAVKSEFLRSATETYAASHEVTLLVCSHVSPCLKISRTPCHIATCSASEVSEVFRRPLLEDWRN